MMLILLLLFLASLIIILKKSRHSSKNLPPGSFGFPVVGQSLGLLRAMWANKAEDWIACRIDKYGPVQKLSLFGAPAVFLTGQAANKFVFNNPDVVPQQPKSITRLMGKRIMLEMYGDDHKRLRGAVEDFLRIDALKKYVGRIDAEVRRHIDENWTGRNTVKVLPLSKTLTFNIICSLIIGIERGPFRDSLINDFVHLIAGAWAVPINLPFTTYSKSLRSSRNARKAITKIVNERRKLIRDTSASKDLITHLISLKKENCDEMLTDEEIIDNVLLVMVAGYDTSSVLITFIIRHLANDHVAYEEVVREQEEIAKSKGSPNEALTWDDILKMKYTWRVAMEVLRTVPPLFGSFRKTLKDVEYAGYTIPKGWQVFWVTYATHMDPKIFKEPEKFDPSRFESSVPPYSFIPFGAGPRVCPGSDFARLETVVMLHYVVTKFKWKLSCKEDVFRRNPMPSPVDGLPILLEPKSII